MRYAVLVLIGFTAVLTCEQQSSDAAVVLASDDYEAVPNPPNLFYGDTTGTGLGAHTDFSGSGGIFWQTGSRRIDGNGSLGMFSGGSSESFGRTFTYNPVTTFPTFPAAAFDISMRMDIPNQTSNLKGFNLKSALGSGFGDNELISVGMTNGSNTALLVTDVGGQHTLPLGSELRGNILDLNVQWDVVTGAYLLTANIRTQSPVSLSGTLKNPGDYIPRAVAFIHADNTTNPGQDIMFDNLKLSAVPETSPLLTIPAVAMLTAGCIGLSRWRAGRAAIEKSAA